MKSDKIESCKIDIPKVVMSPEKSQKVTEYFLQKDYNKEYRMDLIKEEERHLQAMDSPMLRKLKKLGMASPLSSSIDSLPVISEVQTPKSTSQDRMLSKVTSIPAPQSSEF